MLLWAGLCCEDEHRDSVVRIVGVNTRNRLVLIRWLGCVLLFLLVFTCSAIWSRLSKIDFAEASFAFSRSSSNIVLWR